MPTHMQFNGVLLPYILKAISAAAPQRFVQIAGWLGLDTASFSAADAGVAVADAITRLSAQIGIPTKMSALGVARDQLELFTREASQINRLLDNSPLVLASDQIYQIYLEAL